MKRKEAERLSESWLRNMALTDDAIKNTTPILASLLLRTYKKGVKEGQNPSCSSKCRHNKIVTPITKGRKPNVQRAK